MKRFILKKDHPYAPKGTIVEEGYDNGYVKFFRNVDKGQMDIRLEDICIPLSIMDQWLEEVKEEVSCMKEFAKALKEELERTDLIRTHIRDWIDEHTLKSE